jgi:hypothetical protein
MDLLSDASTVKRQWDFYVLSPGRKENAPKLILPKRAILLDAPLKSAVPPLGRRRDEMLIESLGIEDGRIYARSGKPDHLQAGLLAAK